MSGQSRRKCSGKAAAADASPVATEEQANKKQRGGSSNARSSSSATAAAAAGSALPSAAAAAAPSPSAVAAVSRAILAPQRALKTLKLVDALASTEGTIVSRAQAVADLLTACAETDDQFLMLDMSLALPDGVAPWFLLLRWWAALFGSPPDEDNETQARRHEAGEILHWVLAPLLPELLASFDPLATLPTTGNNALCEMAWLLLPVGKCVMEDVVRAMAERGVSVHHRNRLGQTPMHVQASRCNDRSAFAFFVPLYLSLGAKLSAQDDAGDTVLHILIRKRALLVLQDLFERPEALHLEYHVCNNNGQTPVDLAASIVAMEETDVSLRIYRLIFAQQGVSKAHVQPAFLSLLMEHTPMIKDCAKVIVQYLDGDGPAFQLPSQPEEQAAPQAATQPAAAEAPGGMQID